MADQTNVRVWRAHKDSRAGIKLQSESIEIIGDARTGIQVGPGGVVVTGKSFAIGNTSDNIRTGGFFIMPDDFVSMIPSTIVTPLAMRSPYPPVGLPIVMLKLLPPIMAMALVFAIPA